MIIVNAIVEADPATIEKLKDAIRAVEAGSRAEEGCDDYTFSVELSDPSRMRITERWHHQDALRAHFATPHMAAFQAAMAENPPRGLKVHFYEAEEIEFRP